MTYLILGACFCLAGFIVADLVATGWIAALLALAGDGPRRWSPSQRRRLFAAARVLPCAAALLFAALVVAPGYAGLEPRGARESVGPTLALVALSAIALLARGPLLALGAWRKTRRIETAWLRTADRVEVPRLGLPVWRMREGAAFWMSGLVRPRLIVGAAVLEALTPVELETAYGHELAHVASHDNLVRLCLAGCPGALSVMSLGRRLEREWAGASEAAADWRAVAGSPVAAVELASALVKVARLARPGPGLAASALGEGDVDGRVRSLLAPERPLGAPLIAQAGAWAGLLTPLAAVAALSLDPVVVGALHALAEHLVRRL
jgi:Zn-dependent protease with chaperone function